MNSSLLLLVFFFLGGVGGGDFFCFVLGGVSGVFFLILPNFFSKLPSRLIVTGSMKGFKRTSMFWLARMNICF